MFCWTELFSRRIVSEALSRVCWSRARTWIW